MIPLLKQDGRQSDRALMVQRGTGRLLREMGFAVLPEFTLASGRRADLMGLNASGQLWIVEIKSSVADFRCDLKWPEYSEFCDRLFFAIPPDLPQEIMPDGAGLIVADQWGAEILRTPEPMALHASRRKAVTLAFARSAALRLHGLYDPHNPG